MIELTGDRGNKIYIISPDREPTEYELDTLASLLLEATIIKQRKKASEASSLEPA